MKHRFAVIVLASALATLGLMCLPVTQPAAAEAAQPALSSYFDNTGRTDVLTGGVRMIDITTPDGPHRVWTKRIGNNPKLKVLLLHGGPAVPHDYLEVMDSWLPGAGIEYYYYDQLGAGRSDQPDNDALWTIDRFVDEVEQVRAALQLDSSNFCLFGQSWGGVLAIEYALAHQDKLKCLIISNTVPSFPDYARYADEVLAPGFDPQALQEIRALEAKKDYANPRYMALLMTQHYERHILRMPQANWPEPFNHAFARSNRHIYELMQGPSELGISGRLAQWDRKADIPRIKVPTLVISGEHDTMDPRQMKWMSEQLPHGRLLATQGSHMAMYDDQEAYMKGLIAFLKDIEAGQGR